MNRVNLYIGVLSHGVRKQNGAYGWVLESVRENGERDPRTIDNIAVRENVTDRDLVLEAIAESLGRLNTSCEVTVYLDPEYLVEVFPTPWQQGWVDEWEKNGWKTSKGADVKNADLWKKAAPVLRRNFVDYKKTSAMNSYRNWIYSEMKSALRRNYGDCGDSEKSEAAENKNFAKIV